MAEILTESFCERCGTRYTFESPARRSIPLGALETVGRGIRNFVASGDQTIDEAFAVARAETEQRATAHQLEAFHRTFNFCLSCRQYTCADCWNAVEGRCLTCAPDEHEETHADLAVAAESVTIASGPDASAWPEGAEARLAWPDADAAAADDQPEPVPEGWAEPAAVVEPAPWVEPAAWSEQDAVAEAEPESAAEPGMAAEPEPEAAEPEAAEPEPEIVDEPEPEMAAAPEPETPTSGAEEPQAAAQPPVAAERATRSLFPPGANLDEEIAAYDLRIAALATTAPSPPTSPPAQVIASRAPSPGETPSVTQAMATATVPDLPDPDSRTGPAGTGAGTCPSCGLSLSASARFCRRCGTPQRT
jgi:zinc-ribbon domain